MKNKIIFSMLAISTSLILFTGCFGTQDDKNLQNDNNSSPTPTVEILQFKVEIASAFDELAKDYELETGNKITITTAGGGTDYGAILRGRFGSNDAPAIFNIGGPQDVEEWESMLADLSETTSAETALNGTLDAVTLDGKVLGLPFAQEGYGLIYNKRIFEEAGIDPTTITSFDALEEAVILIDSKKEDLGLKAVFAFPAAETWVTGLHTLSPVIANELGNVNDVFNAKELEFTYSDSYKKTIDLQNDYSVQPTVTLDYSQQVERLFSLQEVALIQQGNWVYGTIEQMDSEFAESGIGMLPLPFKGVSENAIPVGVPMYWAVNSTLPIETQEAAKTFLDWLNTSETGKTYVLESFNFIPAYSGYDLDKISDPLAKDIFSYSLAENTTNWVFMGFPINWGMDVVGQNIQKYVSGNMEWDELVEDVKSNWNSSRK